MPKSKAIQSLYTLRQTLHKFPELSEDEAKTSERIHSFILEHSQPTEVITKIGGHGMAFIYGEGSTSIMFRAELDALPILEKTNLPYTSENIGNSHACGHDGHMTILAGLSLFLNDLDLKDKKVILLFQPAEENGIGAEAILNDDKFKTILPDYVIAFHNLPKYPLHQIVCKAQNFTASVNSMIIKFNGKTAHAAEPFNGHNPSYPISKILSFCENLNEFDTESDNFKIITPVHIEVGKEAYGIAAGEGILRLTMRTWDLELLKDLNAQLESYIKKVCREYDISPSIEYTQFFAANKNDSNIVDLIEAAALKCDLDYQKIQSPFNWGEDFGSFTQKFPGAMFGIGSGINQPALHNPDYDFPNEIISTGINMFKEIIKDIHV
jgi:amidohydrolase